ncbi:MAG: permease [Pleomorphochaeta sp.]
MTIFIKRYKWFLIILTINIIIGIVYPDIGRTSFKNTESNLLEILSVIPPIFILLGLLDVWVDRETMIKYLGKGSKLKGFLIALLLGSVAAGPLYAAFPIALLMVKKRASLFNIFVFIGAWSTTKIPMLTFEMASLGLNFTLTRLCCSLIGITIIAFILNSFINENDEKQIYANAENMI